MSKFSSRPCSGCCRPASPSLPTELGTSQSSPAHNELQGICKNPVQGKSKAGSWERAEGSHQHRPHLKVQHVQARAGLKLPFPGTRRSSPRQASLVSSRSALMNSLARMMSNRGDRKAMNCTKQGEF